MTGNYIQENRLIGSGDRVLLMVSGGADSVAMFHLLNMLSSGVEGIGTNGFSLGICHVNYGCRGNGSDADEALVRSLGDQHRIQVHSLRAPEPPRSNFQAWARDFRYLAAENLCRWQGYTRIAVGHNRDDRVETFIYRLITYSGRRSLAVMPPRRGKIVRPLLFLTAAEIREFCRQAGIAYHQDESNSGMDYRRNRIRHKVMPALAEIRPDFRQRVEDTISLLEDEQEVLASLTDEAWGEVASGEEQEVLAAASLSLLDRAVARLVVRRWLARAGAGEGMTRRLLDAIIDLCSDSSGTRSLSLPGGWEVERCYDRLTLVVAGTGGREESLGPVELPVPGKVAFGEFDIVAEVDAAGTRKAVDMHSDDPLRTAVDAGCSPGPLTVRCWREGDRFRPLGMNGTRSLQDLFTDGKVPRYQRRHLPIITLGDEIVWVCGMRVSEDFRVTSKSERIIRLAAVRREIENAV
ncbi:tRNA(Ile)-lysidine synthase [bacterium BMS3Abin01]|nr:tRNA(Ile)-lysidine synthase [bacterium BMS3Abin01]